MKSKNKTKSQLISKTEETILSAIGDAISIQGTDFKILYQNQTHKNLLGDHIGECCYRAYRQREDICEDCPVALSFKDGQVHNVERSLITDKEMLYVGVTVSPLRNSKGEIIAGIEVVRDITKRKMTEKELDFERQQLLSIFDSIDEVVYVSDPEAYEVIYANNSVREKFGNVVGQKCFKVFQNMESPCPFCTNDRIFGENEGQIYIWEFQNRVNRRWYHCIDKAIRWPDGRMVRYEMAVDITERKKAEETLYESEEKYRILVDNIQDGVFVIQDAKIQFANWAFAKMVGYTVEEIIGMNVQDLIAPEDLEFVIDRYYRRQAGENVPREYEFRMLHKDRTTRVVVNMNVGVINFQGKVASVGTVKDITKHKKMEAELQSAQKLESLGILAGGIAHDFNNILTAIAGNISLAKMYAKPGLEVFDILTEIEKASLRAKNLTKQLLTFSKGGIPLKKIVSTSKLIEDSTSFALSGANVKCEFHIADDIWDIEVDEGQISHAINNLIRNAQQAMPGGGIIEVTAENITVTESHLSLLKGKQYVKMSIKDYGIGIPEEHLQKVFDPYFTTKQEGSGLGLATAYSIIKKHDGHISVESRLGVGTTFHVYIPASTERAPVLKEPMKIPSITRGKGKILIMDDEEIVRLVVGRMLGQCGYDAESAEDGTGAIELYKRAKESGQPYDAVIIDLVIPAGMGGKEAIKKLLEIDPEVKAIVSSGYSDDPVMANYKEYGFKGVLAKPYDIGELKLVLHNVIIGTTEG